MPVSRKKSCVECRTSKTRCNLKPICSRCADRGLRCEYIGSYPHPSASKQINGPPDRVLGLRDPQTSAVVPGPTNDLNSRGLENGTAGGFEIGQSIESFSQQTSELQSSLAQGSDTMQGLNTGLQDNTWPQSSSSPLWTFDSLEPNALEGLSLGTVPEISENYSTISSLITQKTASVQILHNQDWDQMETSLCEPSNFVTHSGVGYGLIFSKMFAPNVCFKKKTPSMKTALLVQVLIGQTSSYPRLLAQGRLPPYIYPSCVLDSRLPKNCVIDGVHRCLPDSLATCASLVGMFYVAGHTAQIRSIVWKSIYSELEKLRDEVLVLLHEKYI
jgi:Zn(2)-Cys(6) binuclear cluster domain-containing protein